MTTETNYDTIFGRNAVDQGLCTKEELKYALAKLKGRAKENPVMLKDMLVALGFVTKSQAKRLIVHIKENKSAIQQIPGYKILGKIGGGDSKKAVQAETRIKVGLCDTD